MSNPSYQPLQKSDEIRLLILYPGSGSDPIKCTLTNARLLERPTYEALSYMWGPEGDLRIVDIDGRSCQIRENLWSALRRLRLSETLRVLWVDAICINQEDDMERGHQVAQMGKIYSYANTVCVWLGLSDDSTARSAFQLLRKTSEEPVYEARGLDYLKHYRGSIGPLGCLCKLGYWERIWIIQEILLAANIQVYWGDSDLPWDTLSSSLHILGNIQIPEGNEITTRNTPSAARDDYWEFPLAVKGTAAQRLCQHQRLRLLDQNVSTISGNNEDALMTLVIKYSSAKCSDFRDHVFGMHSLALSCCRSAMPIDYSCSVYLLCGRLLDHHLYNHGNEQGMEMTISLSCWLHGYMIEAAIQQNKHLGPFIFSGREFEGDKLESKEVAHFKRTGRIKVLGFLGSSLFYVTPPLRSTSISEEVTGLPDDLREMLCRRIKPITVSAAHCSRAIQLIEEISEQHSNCPEEDEHFKSTEGLFFSHLDDKASQPGKELLGAHQAAIQTSQTFPESNFSILLSSISRMISTHKSGKDCVLFFEKGGIVGLAPVNARVGDLVCKFEYSDTLAIVRKVHGEYMIVGRAINLRAWPIDRKLGEPVIIDLGISSLQLLTTIPVYDENFENQFLYEGSSVNSRFYEPTRRVEKPGLEAMAPSYIYHR